MKQPQVNSLTLVIIDSTLYKKLRPYRYLLYFISLFLIATLIKPRPNRYSVATKNYPSIVELLELNTNLISCLLLLILISSFLLYKYSANHKRLGFLKLDTSFITVNYNNNPEIIFEIEKLDNIKISRGATIHYAYKEFTPPETNDNWIYISCNNSNYAYEFMIDNEILNSSFEEMIRALRKKYLNFTYESI
jgi:hypothetical protein